ncbi:MAG: response regulator transcription factor [Lachnospiraceae bacterium]
MYHILLLHEMQEGDCRVKEYLQLSGFEVTEFDARTEIKFEREIKQKDLVLLICEEVEMYFYLCEKLRIITEIPIVVLTKSDDEWAKIKMFQLGVDDYLVEPCQRGELIARIQARIQQYKRLTRVFGYIQVRGLTIEVLNRKVFLNDKEILLTVKEFDVLLYLAQRANIVVKKEELYMAIWKDDLGEGFYNSVASYVKKIREKIEPNPESPKYIETIWGIGYRFVS